jgi:hypothetical protein
MSPVPHFIVEYTDNIKATNRAAEDGSIEVFLFAETENATPLSRGKIVFAIDDTSESWSVPWANLARDRGLLERHSRGRWTF